MVWSDLTGLLSSKFLLQLMKKIVLFQFLYFLQTLVALRLLRAVVVPNLPQRGIFCEL